MRIDKGRAHRTFAVEREDINDDEPFVTVFRSGFDDPGMALAPIMAALREESHAVAVALDPRAVAVIF